MTNITATYKNGTFVLDEPVKIKDGAKVELMVMENKKERETRREDIGRNSRSSARRKSGSVLGA